MKVTANNLERKYVTLVPYDYRHPVRALNHVMVQLILKNIHVTELATTGSHEYGYYDIGISNKIS